MRNIAAGESMTGQEESMTGQEEKRATWRPGIFTCMCGAVRVDTNLPHRPTCDVCLREWVLVFGGTAILVNQPSPVTADPPASDDGHSPAS